MTLPDTRPESMLGDWNDCARRHGRKQRRTLTEAERVAIMLLWGKAYPVFDAGAAQGLELAQILMDRP